MEEFKTGQQEHYRSVVNVEYSFFIKPWYAQTKAFILTLNLDSPPATIYIPGERNNTVVHPYMDRPLRCKNCQMYGHSKKGCNRNTRCKKCGGVGHDEEACGSQEPECANSKFTSSRKSWLPKGTRREKDFRSTGKSEDWSTESTTNPERRWRTSNSAFGGIFCNTFYLRSWWSWKRIITTWVLQRCLQHSLGNKPVSIRSNSKTTFIILVAHRQGGCLACCGCTFDSYWGGIDLYYARGAQGVLRMRAGGATSQLDLPSLMPLSGAGCDWL